MCAQLKEFGTVRYQVPAQEAFPLLQNVSEVDNESLAYNVTHARVSENFYFVVQRKKDGAVL